MRVLLCVTDLFRDVGGGQTVYRQLVLGAPHIHFVYLRSDEAPDGARPVNCTVFTLRSSRNVTPDIPPPVHESVLVALQMADRIARSVSGQFFDVVDCPDFVTFGSFLRAAFAHHHVMVGALVLAMHGNLSRSVSLNWGTFGDTVLHHQALEHSQFRCVDGAYALSKRYAAEWQARYQRDIAVIDPASLVRLSMAKATVRSGDGIPTLVSIGRNERLKGDDLFIDLASRVRAFEPVAVQHFGPDDLRASGTSPRSILKEVARRRAVPMDFHGPRTPSQVQALMAGRIMVVLAVRYDTLNLVALETIAAGCPVAISDGAGVTDYLDVEFPDIPYVRMPLGNLSSAVPEIVAVLRDYDSYRERVTAAVSRYASRFGHGFDITSVYSAATERRSRALALSPDNLITYRTYVSPRGEALALIPSQLRSPARFVSRNVLSVGRSVRDVRQSLLNASYRLASSFMREPYVRVVAKALRNLVRLQSLGHRDESGRVGVREKLVQAYSYEGAAPGRVNLWNEIARLERILGNDLVAATYDLRLLRLVPDARILQLEAVESALRTFGFSAEASLIPLLYGPQNSVSGLRAYLDERAEALRLVSFGPPLVHETHRTGKTPRVSVIVSLYNAAPKLRAFLASLSLTFPLLENALEVVLIDSASPVDERSVIREFVQTQAVDVTYIRSFERETIQAAWNRGIAASRAPYLVFLGADESVLPHALKVLADHLDAHPKVDWVMGNSIVTEVEDTGLHKADVMVYDRRGASKYHALLETCYLSWVGGMYRRSIHDRLGYYDPTFGAAGDTEFKNRVLPNISVDFVDQPLGIFLNYPDGQTTASPRAEIEDLRAWYLHRTLAGASSAFDAEPTHVVEALLRRALWYRKSYRTDYSTDLDYASVLASYLQARHPGVAQYSEAASELAQVVGLHRSLELVPRAIGWIETSRHIATVLPELSRAELRLRGRFDVPDLKLEIFNDNRFEQHSWLWKTTNA